MKVKDVMNNTVICVKSNTSPIKAFEKMYKEGVRRLFILNENKKAEGVVSYTDLVGVLGTQKPTSTNNISNIKEIMTTNIITIDAEDEIEAAANLMVRADVSGLLVLDLNKPVGVITKTDICRLVASEKYVEAID
jgi:predicted transcriptional regulator